MNIFNKIRENSKIIQKIIHFNESNKSKNYINTKNLILVEFTTNKSLQACFSIFLNNLQKIKRSKLLAYNSDLNILERNRLKKYFSKIYKNFNYKIFESFGVTDFLKVEKNEKIMEKFDKISNTKKYQITTKKKLLKFKINNVWIGDLIYDSYLAKYLVPTVDLNSKKFFSFYKNFLLGFFFWENFFEDNDVKAVIGSHSVYQTALPMRIAIKRKIDVFQVNFHNLYRLSNKKLFAYDIFGDYKKIFSKFKKNYQNKAIFFARKRCLKRFKGNVGVDMHYSTKSAFNNFNKSTQYLNKSNKKKILIAAHCFLDNPHPYGIKALFNDFHEWFDFLGNFSKKTNFEWYVKTHPDFKPETQKIINEFVSKYKNLKLLPSNISHHQIIKEGINCVLTVHGTIAWEYAYFKIPVINASLNNPHINFNFSYHPKSIKEYKESILNFDKLKLNFSKKEIYKFYFMHYIYRNSDWIIDDLDKFLHEIKGYKNISNLTFYKNFLRKNNKKKINTINNKISKFLAHRDFLIPGKI